HRSDGRLGFAPRHLAPPWIDGIDLARESVADEEAHDAPAELVRAVRGAEDGDGPRVKDAFDPDARGGAAVRQLRGVESPRHRLTGHVHRQRVTCDLLISIGALPRHPPALGACVGHLSRAIGRGKLAVRGSTIESAMSNADRKST